MEDVSNLRLLKIYKGFDIEFLKDFDIKSALVESAIEDKLDVLKFDTKTRKQLDAALTLLDDNDSKWLTYEEYSLIKDRVALSVDDYGLKATVIVNNLYADVFPAPFNLDDNIYVEIKNAENSENKESLSESAKKIMNVN